MVFIYTNQITNRLQYVCEIVFKVIFESEYTFVDRATFEQNETQPQLNYSSAFFENAINITPHTLLFEENIISQAFQVHWKNNLPFFYKTAENTLIEYDLFAMIFYMVSRYEEYLPFEPDVHRRFTAKNSIAHKANFLEYPIVHLWAKELINKLLEKYPHFQFSERKFEQYNTIDIDIAYSIKGKPFTRQIGGCLKALFKFDFQDLKQRIHYYTSGKDPFDTYDFIAQSIEKSQIPAIFFIELGKIGKFDKNLPLNSTLKNLIKRLYKIGKIGIHPSYQSNRDSKKLKCEIDSLSSVLDDKVVLSRQHFLKLELPTTYENLIANGITSDFTMGYADHIGFRSGMCVPYPFFNLIKNEIRPLSIVPFQIMDGTLKDYMQLDVESAQKKVAEIKESIHLVNGKFITIFHNSSLTNTGAWKDWTLVYKNILSID